MLASDVLASDKADVLHQRLLEHPRIGGGLLRGYSGKGPAYPRMLLAVSIILEAVWLFCGGGVVVLGFCVGLGGVRRYMVIN